MAVFTFTSLAAAARAIPRDMRARDQRLVVARRKTAKDAAKLVARRIPRAFGELMDSIHIEELQQETDVVVDAPHSAAVEVGSRPHMPPLEPLIHWVQLRGMQGLSPSGMVRRFHNKRSALTGVSLGELESQSAARSVAQSLRARLGRAGAKAWRARAMLGSLAQRELGHDPATVAIARAIQMAIAKNGTKPRRYMANTVPPTIQVLDAYVQQALPDP